MKPRGGVVQDSGAQNAVAGSRLRLSLPRLALPVISAACLAVGLAALGALGAALAALAGGAVMLLTRRWRKVWLATGSLAALTALAAYGLLAAGANTGLLVQATALLMLAGTAAALAGWDLALEEITRPAEAAPGETSGGAPSGSLETRRLRVLGLAVGAGLLAGAVGQTIQVRLPFIVVALLVGLAAWALERALRSIKM